MDAVPLMYACMLLQLEQLQHQLRDSHTAHQAEKDEMERTLAAEHRQALQDLQQQHKAERERWKREQRQQDAQAVGKAPEASNQGHAAEDDPALVQELMAEIEHLRQEKADAEAQADELASSLAAERRRSEQVCTRHGLRIELSIH